MQKASAGAQASDAALAEQAKQNTLFASSARNKLFGADNASGNYSGGTISGFLDPNTLNVSGPTGAHQLQYNKNVENIARSGQQARGATSDYLANRGFGNGPSGFGADQARRATQAQVDSQGQAFTDQTNNSYNDALSNFWRANDALQGGGNAGMSAAIQGNQAAAGNYANLYGTASTPVQSGWNTVAGLAGSALGGWASGGFKKPGG